MTQYYMLLVVFQLPLQSIVYKLILFLFTELNLLTFYLFWRAFIYALMVLSVVIFPLLEIFRIMLNQLKEQLTGPLLLKKRKNLAFLKEESSFREQYIKAIVLISKCSSSYVGKAFLPYLILNSCANTVLLTTLISSSTSLSLLGKGLVVVFALDESVGLFQVHLLLAQLNGRLRRCAIRYTVQHVKNRGKNGSTGNRKRPSLVSEKHLHENVCSWLFIEKFATTTQKAYGFKYSQFGQISTLNYVRFCLLYSELLMFVFKNFI